MVNIENITKQEEDRNLKFKRTKDLLNKFFDNPYTIGVSNISISVSENLQSPPFLSIDIVSDKMRLFIPDTDIPKYTDKTLAFAREYEADFGGEVTLKTDYSKR